VVVLVSVVVLVEFVVFGVVVLVELDEAVPDGVFLVLEVAVAVDDFVAVDPVVAFESVVEVPVLDGLVELVLLLVEVLV